MKEDNVSGDLQTLKTRLLTEAEKRAVENRPIIELLSFSVSFIVSNRKCSVEGKHIC